jgi:hypothetical protein
VTVIVDKILFETFAADYLIAKKREAFRAVHMLFGQKLLQRFPEMSV